jgi:site-specific recombinase XerD
VNDRNDLRVAQLMARHASPDTTAGYTRVPKEKMEAASRRLSFAQLRPVVNE